MEPGRIKCETEWLQFAIAIIHQALAAEAIAEMSLLTFSHQALTRVDITFKIMQHIAPGQHLIALLSGHHGKVTMTTNMDLVWFT